MFYSPLSPLRNFSFAEIKFLLFKKEIFSFPLTKQCKMDRRLQHADKKTEYSRYPACFSWQGKKMNWVKKQKSQTWCWGTGKEGVTAGKKSSLQHHWERGKDFVGTRMLSFPQGYDNFWLCLTENISAEYWKNLKPRRHDGKGDVGLDKWKCKGQFIPRGSPVSL